MDPASPSEPSFADMDAALEQGSDAGISLGPLIGGLIAALACCLLTWLALVVYGKRKGIKLRRREPFRARATDGQRASIIRRAPSMRPQIGPVLLHDGMEEVDDDIRWPQEFVPSLSATDIDTPRIRGGNIEVQMAKGGGRSFMTASKVTVLQPSNGIQRDNTRPPDATRQSSTMAPSVELIMAPAKEPAAMRSQHEQLTMERIRHAKSKAGGGVTGSASLGRLQVATDAAHAGGGGESVKRATTLPGSEEEALKTDAVVGAAVATVSVKPDDLIKFV